MAYNHNGNQFKRTAPIVLNLIIINGLVYIAQRLYDGDTFAVTSVLALSPINSGHFKIYQLLTSVFAHDPNSMFHILINMFVLWNFGTMLEKSWGSKRFLIFYLICGIAASVVQMFVSSSISLGASGAIMGLLGAYAYLYPNTQMIIFPIPFPIKAKYALGIIAAIDIFGGIQPTDNIAHWAHLGGLAMGLLLVIFWNKTNRNTFY